MEDLRIMIGQNIGLDYLLPLAMDVLRDNPVASGDFYEGDLLKVTIECDVVQQDKDNKLCGELAYLCMKAILLNAENDMLDHSDETSPKIFNQDRKTNEQLLQAKIEELKSETPWHEFQQFFLTHGND